jgi:hypothetical protein
MRDYRDPGMRTKPITSPEKFFSILQAGRRLTEWIRIDRPSFREAEAG